jgi:type I restriction enzyme S subunit
MRPVWQTKTLGEVCRFIDYRGKTPEKTESGLRLITAKNVKMGFLQKHPEEFVNPNTYDSWMTRGIPRPGDVLFTTEAPLANVAQLDTDEPVVFAQRIIILQPSDSNLDRTFLKYLLLSEVVQRRIHAKGTGATVKGIKASLLKTIEVSFPPLSKQRQIVKQLDEAFASLAIAQANAVKNLQNARVLFESHLQSVFTNRSKGWVEHKLGDVCDFVGGSQPPKEVFSRVKAPDSIRLVQIRDYKSDNHVVYIPNALAKRFCAAEDIMIGRYGPPIFQILRGLEGAYNVALMKAVPDETQVTRDFLFYFLKHPAILQYVIYHSERAAGQIGVTKETLAPFLIGLPSLEEQQKVAKNIHALAGETQRLTRLYEQKLSALAALKRSLLHRAFTGEL